MWSVQTAYPQPQGAETCNVVVLPSDKLCHLVVENLFILLSHRLPVSIPFFCGLISPKFRFVLGYNVDIKRVGDLAQNALP